MFLFSMSGQLSKIFTRGNERPWKWLCYSQVCWRFEQGKFYRHGIVKLTEILKLFKLVLLFIDEDTEPRKMASLLNMICKPQSPGHYEYVFLVKFIFKSLIFFVHIITLVFPLMFSVLEALSSIIISLLEFISFLVSIFMKGLLLIK